MSDLLGNLGSRWMWALGLAVGFPAVLLLLGELAFALARGNRPLAPVLRAVRTWVVPVVALVLFLRHVLSLPGDALALRLAQTALWVSVVIAALGAVNIGVFEHAAPGSWQRRVPRLLRDLIGLLVVAAAGALVYSFVWDREITGALAALGVTSIVVGLALQEPLGNLFSGLMLLMERPFEVGEVVEVAGSSGVVKEINWRSAHIKSARGVVQIVPNSMLNKEIINNYSRPRPVRLEEVEVGFSYDDPPNAVREALLEVARATPGVFQDPPPIAATFAYGDSAITYRLIYRTTEDDRWPVRNEVMTRIWYAARRHGLTIPFPIVTNINHFADEPFGKRSPSAAEQLRGVASPSSAPASGAETRDVKSVTFGRSEVIFEEGAELSGVYLLVSGAVSLQLVRRGQAREIAVVGAGEFFGEAGLYGVQPTDTRAVALEDSDVLWMAPETVRVLFESSPKLARETGHALDVRRRARLAARSSMKAD
jgi:small-conductance mechanosensitive channel